MKRMILFTLALFCGAAAPAAENNFAVTPEKKLIKFGWDNPDTYYIEAHFDEIEEGMRAYDGMGIDFNSKAFSRNGRRAGSDCMMFGSWKWRKSWFDKETAQLKKANAAFKNLKYNFINTNSMAEVANKFDWFDDKVWDAINNNFGILAEIAKETGCRGLNIDIENYERQTFQYDPAKGHSYEETWDKARQRGREFIKAITDKYPDIVLHTFFWLDTNHGNADGKTSPYVKAKTTIMGLALPFINGIYDALPETATIVEGMEGGGYRANEPADYSVVAANRIQKAKLLIDPKNLEKYMRRTQLGMGTYLDRYINTDPSSIYFISNDSEKNLAMLKRNLTAAVNTVDEYLWTWSEARAWYPWPYNIAWMKKATERVKRPGITFEKAMPGITDVLVYAKSPEKFYRSKIEKNELGECLLRNSSFDSAKGSSQRVPDSVSIASIRPWGFWQQSKSKGTVEVKDGLLTFKNVDGGCILQIIPVKPGAAYYLRARGKGDFSNAVLSVGWQDKKGRWDFWGFNTNAVFSKELGNGMKEASMLLFGDSMIPVKACRMSVQIDVKNNADFSVDSVEAFEIK